jgi:hypothetical protein
VLAARQLHGERRGKMCAAVSSSPLQRAKNENKKKKKKLVPSWPPFVAAAGEGDCGRTMEDLLVAGHLPSRPEDTLRRLPPLPFVIAAAAAAACPCHNSLRICEPGARPGIATRPETGGG